MVKEILQGLLIILKLPLKMLFFWSTIQNGRNGWFYSIINFLSRKGSENKAQLKLYIVLISILTLTLTILFLYIYRQMKHKSKMKEDLYISNNKLVLLNNELNESNDYLFEANLIKEQYIIHFLDLCSDYITKWKITESV